MSSIIFLIWAPGCSGGLGTAKGNTWQNACLATHRHSAVLPAYVGIRGVTPGPVADSSGVPTVVV